MVDNGDGTYSYSYSVSLDGTVTVFVYQDTYITGTFYGSMGLTGTSTVKSISDMSGP